jgi:hypothetical protein
LVKLAAVPIEKLADADGVPSRAPTTTASEPISPDVPTTTGGEGVRETVEAGS